MCLRAKLLVKKKKNLYLCHFLGVQIGLILPNMYQKRQKLSKIRRVPPPHQRFCPGPTPPPITPSCPQVRQHRPALLLRGGADRGGQAANQPRGQQGLNQQGGEDRPRDGWAGLRQDAQELKISDIYNCPFDSR